MAANNDPIYSRTPDIQGMLGLYALTALGNDADLSAAVLNTDVWLVFTADATNGGYVQKLRIRSQPAGTNTATVGRIWLNNGSTIGTATNSTLIDEITLPTTTGTQVAATANYEVPLNFPLPAGWKIYFSLGTTVTGGWTVTCFGGKY